MILEHQHSRRIRLPEDDTDALKHVRVLTIYKTLYIHIYICCAFVVLDNKLYKTHGTYSKKDCKFYLTINFIMGHAAGGAVG